MQIPYFFPQVEYGSDISTYWGFTLIICLLLLALSYLKTSIRKK